MLFDAEQSRVIVFLSSVAVAELDGIFAVEFLVFLVGFFAAFTAK